MVRKRMTRIQQKAMFAKMGNRRPIANIMPQIITSQKIVKPFIRLKEMPKKKFTIQGITAAGVRKPIKVSKFDPLKDTSFGDLTLAVKRRTSFEGNAENPIQDASKYDFAKHESRADTAIYGRKKGSTGKYTLLDFTGGG